MTPPPNAFEKLQAVVVVDDHGVGVAERVLADVPLRRPREHVIGHPAGLRHAGQPQVGGHRDQHGRMFRLVSADLASFRPPAWVKQSRNPVRASRLDQQRGDRRERQHAGQLVLRAPWPPPGYPQPATAAPPGGRRHPAGPPRDHRAGNRRGPTPFQRAPRAVPPFPAQGARGGCGLADQPAVLVLPRCPLPGRVQVGRGVGVPAARDPGTNTSPERSPSRRHRVTHSSQ